MLVYFPSDNRYLHTALPVTKGTRHAIVSWISQHGVEKLRPPPEDVVQLQEPAS
jgi:predicted 2-oxoglutarate/Fe(II)-dependent dioxygenase YbiX